MQNTTEFHGAKLAILKARQLVSILRDDTPEIAFPNMWDLPGGGREEGETPEACVLRELQEELSITLTEADLIWKNAYASDHVGGAQTWFFVAEMPDLDINQLRLGDEGQAWRMWDVDRFLRLSNAVPHMQARLSDYLKDRTL